MLFLRSLGPLALGSSPCCSTPHRDKRVVTVRYHRRSFRSAVLHLLLVEDNPADVLMVREGLRASAIPVDVMIAYDGEQALRLLGEMHFKPDFIILDLAIPKFDGLTVL